ncbi:MAG: DNA cytosine methyltransferase [Bdellovibrionota bacterium]
MAGLFSGCGGLEYGFVEAGFKSVWANEFNPSAAASFETLLNAECIVDDFWNIEKVIPKTDIVIGGPPCQSFSLVGKRSQDDERGKLVFGFMEAIRATRPRAFVMENVAGLAASSIGNQRLPDYLAEEFRKMGYEVIVEKLDASNYLVPQKRKRIFVIGVMNPKKPLKVIDPIDFREFINQKYSLNFDSNLVSVFEALNDLPSPELDRNSNFGVTYKLPAISNYSQLMRRGMQEFVTLQDMPTMSALDREFVKFIPPGGNYVDIPEHLDTVRIKKFKKSGGRTTTYGRLHPDEPSYTINTYFNRPNVGANYHYRDLRLITVREALRLQSFPDFFVPKFKNQRELHQQIGNAVPPLLAMAVALSIRTVLG